LNFADRSISFHIRDSFQMTTIPDSFVRAIEAKQFDNLSKDPNWTKYKDAIFPWVCAHTDETTVQFFLNNGADPAYKKDNSLYAACTNGNLEIVKILLTYESVQSHAAGHGNRSLITAEQNNYTEIVELLMKIPSVAEGPSMSNLF
jgi:ankyrin repeat protein